MEEFCQKLSPNRATKEKGGIDFEQEGRSNFPQKYLNKRVKVNAVITQKITTRNEDCLTPSVCMNFPL
jgi:hypothetical protein